MANFALAILIFAGFFAVVGNPFTPNIVSAVQQGGPADAAGVLPGDRIVSLDGRSTANFQDIALVTTLRRGAHVTVIVERGERRLAIPVTIATAVERDRFGQKFRVGRLGVYGRHREFARVSVWRAIPAAARYTFAVTRASIDGLWRIISGRLSVKELGGPMKMAQIAGQQATLGVFEFVQLLAWFSINLGFINLLPVPMLDGGHLVFYAIEAVRRRPVGLVAQEWAFRGGLAALLALILFTTVNDLTSFGLWDRLGRLIG